jgi:threonine dehydrogenase-like Zn-dependent dehydrogenase
MQHTKTRNVSEATNDRGADSVLEAVDHTGTMRETFEIARHSGSVVIIGMSHAQPSRGFELFDKKIDKP